jgi:hypothetical protein
LTQRPSAYVLILANLIPVAGVLLFDWNVLSILMLYWAESVVIGIINVLRMICCQSDNILQMLPLPGGQAVPKEVSAALNQAMPKLSWTGIKFFLVPFFMVHYGGFCFGHLSLLLAFSSGGPRPISAASSMLDLWQPSFWIAVAAIFCSHLYSFFTNYIGNDEYKRASLVVLMFRPYGRIIAMQLAIIFGAAFVMFFGSPLPMLLILIAVKIVIDLRLHGKERMKFSLLRAVEVGSPNSKSLL